jgi:hypothetical protein
MRFFEFGGSSDKFILLIKNFIGRAQSKKQPAKLNWATLNSMLASAGEEAMDYETFKAMYDANPPLQPLIANFNADGIELKVPGVAKEPEQGADQAPPQDQVAQQAASVAQNQIQS